jgi:S1-C subfamily serine protease
VLRTSLSLPVLSRRPDTARGTTAAVLGFPENGPYDVSPARFGETTEVLSEDAYGNGSIRRRIASFRGLVRSGNSGGPIIDGSGRVIGTVFASTQGGPPSGFAVPNAPVATAIAGAGNAVDTGPCTG